MSSAKKVLRRSKGGEGEAEEGRRAEAEDAVVLKFFFFSRSRLSFD